MIRWKIFTFNRMTLERGGTFHITVPLCRESTGNPVDSQRKRTGPRLNIKTVLSRYGDSYVKDKTAVRRLIFNMGIAIPGKTVFLIETAPSSAELWCFLWCWTGYAFEQTAERLVKCDRWMLMWCHPIKKVWSLLVMTNILTFGDQGNLPMDIQ